MTYDTGALLGRLDEALANETYGTYLRALEDVGVSIDLEAGVRAFWGQAPSEATIHELLPHHSVPAHATLFGIQEYEMSWVLAAVWWLLCALLPEGAQEVTVVEGPWAPEAAVVHGPLRVQGDLVAGAYDANRPTLVVLGDLIVEGDWRWDGDEVFVRGDVRVLGKAHERSDWSRVIIGGGLEARGTLASRGDLFVAGDVHAPVIELTYNHGQAILLHGASALLFFVSDHDGSWIASPPRAEVVELFEMRVAGSEYPEVQPPRLMFEGLRRILTDAYRERVMPGHAWSEEDGEVVDEDGEVVWMGELLQEISFHLTLGEDEYADVQPPLTELLRSQVLAAFENQAQHPSA